MKKFIIFIMITILLTGCSNTNSECQPISPNSSLNNSENEYLSSNKISQTDYKNYKITSTNEETLYFQNKILFSDMNQKNKIQKYTLSMHNKLAWFWQKIDNEIYYFSQQNGNYPPTINKYNIINKTENELIKLSNNHEAMYKTSSSEYIVWLESSSNFWTDGKLHLYDIISKKDTIIFKYPTEKEANTGQIPIGNPCIIKEDKIYFDSYINENGIKMNLYCYDIKSSRLTLFKEQCQYPIQYGQRLGWVEMEQNSLLPKIHIKGINNNYTISDNSTISIISPIKGNNFIVLYDMLNTPITDTLFNSNKSCNYSQKDVETTSSYGARILANDKIIPILITKEPIGQFVSNNYAVSWSCEKKPQYYDINKKTIVTLDTIPNQSYLCYATDKELIYLNYNNDEVTMYIISFNQD